MSLSSSLEHSCFTSAHASGKEFDVLVTWQTRVYILFMFTRVVALAVLAVWFALIGLGYAASDNLDTYIVPSIIALDSSDYGDDLDNYRAIDLVSLPALFDFNLPEVSLDRSVPNVVRISPNLVTPFELNCSLRL